MKAKLVFAMPSNCFECYVGRQVSIGLFYCIVCKRYRLLDIHLQNGKYDRPDWCPLIPGAEGE
jgi:hypothetical protein